MLNRACRILEKPSRSSGSTSETSTRQAGEAKYTESERLARWKSLALKVFLLFNTIAAQTKAKFLLGIDVYDRMFQTLLKPKPIQEAYSGPIRYVKGQQVGRPLPPGTGVKDQKKAHMDPTMCQHNVSDMQPRGNKTEKWWTCQKCLSRWERIPIRLSNDPTAAEPQPPINQDETLLTFGKYAGETFLQVYLQDPQYCEWAMRTAQQTTQYTELTPFAQYILHQKTRISL